MSVGLANGIVSLAGRTAAQHIRHQTSGEIRMMPAAALAYALSDEDRRDALNRARATRALRSEQTSPAVRRAGRRERVTS
jgi:hypothetical protein